MCNHFSCWLTADRSFWSPRTNSHTDIAEIHQLHIDGARGSNASKAQLLPPLDSATVDDLETWRYDSEQDRQPEWYDAGDARKRVIAVATLARQIDPVWWRTMTAASRDVQWDGRQRSGVLGNWPLVMPSANLRGADLCGADLYGADLYGADLYGADLSDANLSEACYPTGNLPTGWVRNASGFLQRETGADHV